MNWKKILKMPFSPEQFHFKNNNIGDEQATKLFEEHIDPLFEEKRGAPGSPVSIEIPDYVQFAAGTMGMNQKVFIDWLEKLYEGIQLFPQKTNTGSNLRLTLRADTGYNDENQRRQYMPGGSSREGVLLQPGEGGKYTRKLP